MTQGKASSQDVVAGCLFLALGALLAGLATQYPLGEVSRMGPGFFPLAVGILLGLAGAGILLGGLLTDTPQIEGFALRPLVCAAASMIVFALMLNTAGLLAAIVLMVLIACAASSALRIWEAVLLALSLAIFSAGVFAYGLGLPYRIWPSL